MSTTNHGVDTMTHTYTLRIEHDQDCESPLYSDDHLVTWRRRGLRAEASRRSYPRETHCAFLVRCDDGHGPFSQYGLAHNYENANGVLYMDRQAYEGTANGPRALAGLILKEYQQWANGDCYGYVIEDERGEEVESCWGFVGEEYAEQEGKSALEWLQANPKKVLA